MAVAPVPPLIYSRREAAELLRLRLRSVAHLTAHGTLETRKIGGRRLVVPKSVHRLQLVTGLRLAITRQS